MIHPQSWLLHTMVMWSHFWHLATGLHPWLVAASHGYVTTICDALGQFLVGFVSFFKEWICLTAAIHFTTTVTHFTTVIKMVIKSKSSPGASTYGWNFGLYCGHNSRTIWPFCQGCLSMLRCTVEKVLWMPCITVTAKIYLNYSIWKALCLFWWKSVTEIPPDFWTCKEGAPYQPGACGQEAAFLQQLWKQRRRRRSCFLS